MMRVLVTGGAGFIGSHLCRRFLADGASVICLDNFLTGSATNIHDLKRHARFQFIKHDISKPIELKPPVDAILHFASPASPTDYLKYPIQTLKVGSLGTLNALGLAKAKRATFLLASTSEVYGDPQIHPQPETYWGHVNCVGPRGVYDEAKRFAEAMTMAYHRVHGVDTKIARMFNCFGPRMRTTYHEPVNLGNPEEMTLQGLAETILALTGQSTDRIVFRPLPQDDPKQRQPDITRAKTLLQWQPTIPLKEGLSRTVDWFRQQQATVTGTLTKPCA